MSREQIRGYTICKTPQVLLNDDEPLTPENAQNAQNTRTILRGLTGRDIQNKDSIFGDELHDIHGERMKEIRRERISKEISELFKTKHDLTINASQIQNCETFDHLVALVTKTLELQQTN